MKLPIRKAAWVGMMLAGLGLMSSANALVITDFAGSAGRLITQSNPYSYTHNILDNGYVLGSPISSASLSIWLADDAPFGDGSGFGQDAQETAGFNIGLGGNIGTLSQFDFSNFSVSSLLSNGRLNVTISSTGGDFLFGASRLLVNLGNGDARTTPVPEPATLTMFGFGLLAIAIAVRRRRNASAAR